PGIIWTDSIPPAYVLHAKDSVELVGGTALYLGTAKADFLRERWVSVNWDVEEIQSHKEGIERKGLLKTRWLIAELGLKGIFTKGYVEYRPL
ncbi:uncharacterized protein BDR25DRAFT_212759, partial [Lindgomyces ingoldianus]